MKSMAHLQKELISQYLRMEKDIYGYPRIYVCPITGVIQICRTEKEYKFASRLPVWAMLLSIPVAFGVLCLIKWLVTA